MDFSLNAVDDILLESMMDTREYKEYCEAIDELGIILDPELYLEVVSGAGKPFKRTREKIAKNTADTTRSAIDVYGDVTNAGGKMVKAVWDLFIKMIKLASKAINFVFNTIEKTADGISNCMNKVNSIPKDAIGKIKGNIKLNISAIDIQALYDNNMINALIGFCNNSEKLAQGEIWKAAVKPKRGLRSNKKAFTKSDKELANQVVNNYKKFANVKINSAMIDLDDEANVRIYFGNTNAISFVDLKGTHHQCNYYQAIQQLCKDLQEHIDKLRIIKTDLDQKMADTQNNQSFAELPDSDQRLIVDSIRSVAKGIEVIASIIRGVQQDMKTIQDATNTILNRKDQLANSKKKLKGRDKIIANTDINDINNGNSNDGNNSSDGNTDNTNNTPDEYNGYSDQYKNNKANYDQKINENSKVYRNYKKEMTKNGYTRITSNYGLKHPYYNVYKDANFLNNIKNSGIKNWSFDKYLPSHIWVHSDEVSKIVNG